MSRLWCPALSADACATFDTQHLGARPRSPGPDERTKLVSAHATHVAASAQQKVYDAANKIASSPPSKFSSKVASAASRQGEVAPIVNLAQPPVALVATVDDEVAALEQAGIPRSTVVRSVAHLEALPRDDVKRVAHVDLSRVDATTEELAALFREGGALENGALQALTIRHSIRGTLGIQEILKALAARPSTVPLSYLDVSCNPASFSLGGDEPNVPCAEELVKYLATNTGLRTMNLSSTGLGAAGAVAFPALKNHSSVTSLDISRNAIGLQQDEAAVAGIISLVQENKFLLQLDLSDNEISGAFAKQLLDALRTSDTRVKTPEPEPEPEVEEYSDELPPEEEAPQVTVGFPEDEVPPPAEEGAPEAAAPVDDAEPPAPLDVTAEPEGEDEAEATPVPEEPAEEEAVEEDPEAAEAARLEAEEAAAELARQKEEAWRARMTQYIWDPEQILFQYKEAVTRRDATIDYSNTTTQLKKVEKAAKLEAKRAQLHREQVERNRRSGWTHLQDVNLSGNPIANAGAKILALALRHKIPLSAEEQQLAEEAYEKRLTEAKAAARDAILKERARVKAEEASAATAASQPPAVEPAAPSPAPEETGDDINPEDVAVEDEVIPPVPAEEEVVQGDDAAEEGDAKAEGEEEEELDLSHVHVAAADVTRPGIQSIRGLRLDSCSIGSSGLKNLADALSPTVCPSVTLLSLRRNKFAIKKQSVPAAADDSPKNEDADDEGEVATIRVDVPSYVSPGVAALSEALRVCANLTVLDLGWNRMYPETIRTLAAGIRDNKTLTWLGLDGNNFSFVEEGDVRPSALSVLLEAVATQGLISTLLLGSCELEASLKETEITLLATIPELRHLNLSGNQLTSASVAMWGHIVLNLDDDVPRTSLATLSLEGIVSLVGEDGGAAVASVLQAYRGSLKAFSLKSCQQLGDAGVVRIASKFSAITHLQRVNLSRCGIVNGSEVVATAISQKIPTLVAVDISDNEIPLEEFQQALSSMAAAVGDIGVPPLEFVAAWSRSADSEDLLPAFQQLASVASNLQQCDTGIPPVFTKSSAAASQDPNVVYQDLFDDLELQCLRNRVAANAVTAA